jgi:hypothetical protein
VTSLHNNSYISAWVVFEGNSVEFSFPFFFLCNFISLFRLTSPIIQCQQPLILCQFKFMRVSIIYLQVIMYHIHNEHFQRKKKKILRSQTTSRSPYEGSYKKITVFQTRKRKEQDWEIKKCGNLMNKRSCSSTNTIWRETMNSWERYHSVQLCPIIYVIREIVFFSEILEASPSLFPPWSSYFCVVLFK